MSRLLIRGGNRLQGEVTIQGAKNSVLPILAATILTGGSVVLRRCPRLRDVEASIRILQALGCKAGWRGDVLEVDTAGMTGCDVPDALMREMRSSVIFLGAILARCGEASLTSPGGCELGPRRAARKRRSVIPAAASWGPGPSTCTSPASGHLGRRSTIPAAPCTARRKS